MDLAKVRQFQHGFKLNITDNVIRSLENSGMAYSPYFTDSKIYVDIRFSSILNVIYLNIGSLNDEEDRNWFNLKVKVLNGPMLMDSFWGQGYIDIMTMDELKEIKNPRAIIVELQCGLYEGSGHPNQWMNILTSFEDFTPVNFASTGHSQCMDNLIETGQFSDIKIICDDDRDIYAHKCLLISSPYFRALLSENFCGKQIEVIKVQCEVAMMKVVLQFIYSGRVNEHDVSSWPELFKIADFYCLDVLSRHCQLQMMLRVTDQIEDIKTLLKFSLCYNASKLTAFLIRLARNIQRKSCV